ncbi:uncharacterized protein LOC109922780 [Rhincodon typus]|uniref:uncharacterized protein LOC109922780 n=1 Tax=Rhincodon typus TaxID=259920 RepID=UPI00202FE929|nr:uncharacterized protein LOC109922780 [Rhincodon typus]
MGCNLKSTAKTKNVQLLLLSRFGNVPSSIVHDIIFILFTERSAIVGKVGSSVTLPCTYDIDYYGPTRICWGRQECSWLSCNELLVSTDGSQITSPPNSKYQLYGDLKKGDVSLTIHNLRLGDRGKYCCRMKYYGIFNDQKEIIDLIVAFNLVTTSTERYKTTRRKIVTSQANKNTPTINPTTVLGDKSTGRPFKCLSDEKGADTYKECQSGSGSKRAPSNSAFCHLMNWTTEMCNRSSRTDFPVQRVMEFSQRLLSNVSAWKGLDDTERHKAAGYFLQAMASSVIAATQHGQRKEKIKLKTSTLALEIGFIERHNITGSKIVTLQAKEDTLTINPTTVLGDKDSATLAFLSYNDMDSIIGSELVDDESNVSKRLQNNLFHSRVVTVTKGNRAMRNLSGNFSITFNRIQRKQEDVTRGGKVCAVWKPSAEGGSWSSAGCYLTATNATHTECSCRVLSSFAVLLTLYEITFAILLQCSSSTHNVLFMRNDVQLSDIIARLLWGPAALNGGDGQDLLILLDVSPAY